MSRFLFFPHHGREEAVALARQSIGWLEANGHTVVVLEEDAKVTGLTRWAIAGRALQEDPVDLAVSLGGDGTMLRALDTVSSRAVPVLGVNIGHLGYLTELEPEQLQDGLARYLGGDYQVEERMMLEVVVTSASVGDPTQSTISLSRTMAINEVVVEKTTSGNTVRLQAVMNGRPFLTYAVDGMIVATPTGSTAYNLSARGPILSPTLRAMLMTPVSPHMLFDRSLVLDVSEDLELRVIGSRQASVVADGRHIATLTTGGVVSCRASDRSAKIVTFGNRDFRQVLKHKFALADR